MYRDTYMIGYIRINYYMRRCCYNVRSDEAAQRYLACSKCSSTWHSLNYVFGLGPFFGSFSFWGREVFISESVIVNGKYSRCPHVDPGSQFHRHFHNSIQLDSHLLSTSLATGTIFANTILYIKALMGK